MNFKIIQSFRGLAAVSVVAFHLSIGLGDSRYLGHTVLTWLTWRMSLGVDFFFVLSGFIIALAHSTDMGSPSQIGNYIKKRFLRIYPIYWLYVTVFSALVLAGFSSKAQLPSGFLQILSVYSLIRFDNFQLPINPAWTLFHEVIFYFFFAFIILEKRIGLFIFAVWQILCLVHFHYQAPDERTFLNTLLSAGNLDFSFGLAAYYALNHIQIMSWKLGAILGVGILAATLTFEGLGFSLVVYPLIYALSFGLLVFAAAKFERGANSVKLGILPFLGNASYSIYLTHEAFMGLFAKLAVKILGLLGVVGVAVDLVIYFAIFTATIAAGSLLYVIAERPLLKALRGRSVPKSFAGSGAI